MNLIQSPLTYIKSNIKKHPLQFSIFVMCLSFSISFVFFIYVNSLENSNSTEIDKIFHVHTESENLEAELIYLSYSDNTTQCYLGLKNKLMSDRTFFLRGLKENGSIIDISAPHAPILPGKTLIIHFTKLDYAMFILYDYSSMEIIYLKKSDCKNTTSVVLSEFEEKNIL